MGRLDLGVLEVQLPFLVGFGAFPHKPKFVGQEREAGACCLVQASLKIVYAGPSGPAIGAWAPQGVLVQVMLEHFPLPEAVVTPFGYLVVARRLEEQLLSAARCDELAADLVKKRVGI